MSTRSSMEHDQTSTEPLHQRVCARCRRTFDGDATLQFQTDWWLCETCEPILMPARRTPRSTPS